MGNQPLPVGTWPGAYDTAGMPSHVAATPYGYFTNPPLPHPNLPPWLDATYHPGAPTPHWPAQGYHPPLQAHPPPVAPNQSQQTIPGSRSQTSLHRTALPNRPDHAIRGLTSHLRNPPTQFGVLRNGSYGPGVNCDDDAADASAPSAVAVLVSRGVTDFIASTAAGLPVGALPTAAFTCSCCVMTTELPVSLRGLS